MCSRPRQNVKLGTAENCPKKSDARAKLNLLLFCWSRQHRRRPLCLSCLLTRFAALNRRNRPFARWRHFTTTTRILHGFAFLCKHLNLAEITKYKYERKDEKDCRLSVNANNNNNINRNFICVFECTIVNLATYRQFTHAARDCIIKKKKKQKQKAKK